MPRPEDPPTDLHEESADLLAEFDKYSKADIIANDQGEALQDKLRRIQELHNRIQYYLAEIKQFL